MKKWLKTFMKYRFENIWSFCFQISKYKWFEAQAGRFDKSCNTALSIGLTTTTKMSHAGTELTLMLARFHVELRVYDIRHWDEGNECYEGEKVALKRWLVEGCAVGPVKRHLDAEMMRITNELCGLVDILDEDEIKKELPPAEIDRLEERLSDCWISVLACRRRDFTHARQEDEGNEWPENDLIKETDTSPADMF
jgi:hypothetical protein